MKEKKSERKTTFLLSIHFIFFLHIRCLLSSVSLINISFDVEFSRPCIWINHPAKQAKVVDILHQYGRTQNGKNESTSMVSEETGFFTILRV
jgi:hypothetical protein